MFHLEKRVGTQKKLQSEYPSRYTSDHLTKITNPKEFFTSTIKGLPFTVSKVSQFCRSHPFLHFLSLYSQGTPLRDACFIKDHNVPDLSPYLPSLQTPNAGWILNRTLKRSCNFSVYTSLHTVAIQSSHFQIEGPWAAEVNLFHLLSLVTSPIVILLCCSVLQL